MLLFTVQCSPLTARYSLLTVHYSLLSAHYSLLTAHCSLLTAHCSLLNAHRSLLATYCSLFTTHCSALTSHCSPLSSHWWLLFSIKDHKRLSVPKSFNQIHNLWCRLLFPSFFKGKLLANFSTMVQLDVLINEGSLATRRHLQHRKYKFARLA